ncbi:FKBP-type peptidyl-prolyl cis-trans isomerase [Lunatimonas salinarum]|uniref:FKBP-type peptidyl-prolyl cis-trans isomerase n=1 Tax=Lunatimonas salinarum TaxID=1774590 RepID=UPI001AE09201|nr:FKBP-type peptidyl-prolyl cis-trans isomerase [Lunatimonas salinarum]
MNTIRIHLLAFLGLVLASSCVSDEENLEVIFQRDLEAIESYVQNTDVEYVRREDVGDSGVTLLFLESNPEGRQGVARDTLYVDYTGFLLDGTVFDTSVEQIARDNGIFNQNRPYMPFRIELGISSVIGGWHIALSQMREGEKAIALIPSFYAYGTQGSPPTIGPNTVIAFDLDLRSVRGPEPVE